MNNYETQYNYFLLNIKALDKEAAFAMCGCRMSRQKKGYVKHSPFKIILGTFYSRKSSVMPVLERVFSSTVFTITAQYKFGPPDAPGIEPETTTEYGGTSP